MRKQGWRKLRGHESEISRSSRDKRQGDCVAIGRRLNRDQWILCRALVEIGASSCQAHAELVPSSCRAHALLTRARLERGADEEREVGRLGLRLCKLELRFVQLLTKVDDRVCIHAELERARE
eukprot:2633438-Pleurochrysis_carterae.AAC.2